MELDTGRLQKSDIFFDDKNVYVKLSNVLSSKNVDSLNDKLSSGVFLACSTKRIKTFAHGNVAKADSA
jgi:hypothetical protein